MPKVYKKKFKVTQNYWILWFVFWNFKLKNPIKSFLVNPIFKAIHTTIVLYAKLKKVKKPACTPCNMYRITSLPIHKITINATFLLGIHQMKWVTNEYNIMYILTIMHACIYTQQYNSHELTQKIYVYTKRFEWNYSWHSKSVVARCSRRLDVIRDF